MCLCVLRVASKGHTMIPQNEEQKKGLCPPAFVVACRLTFKRELGWAFSGKDTITDCDFHLFSPRMPVTYWTGMTPSPSAPHLKTHADPHGIDVHMG